MKKTTIIIALLIVAWQGSLLYEKNTFSSLPHWFTNLTAKEQLKCITKNGDVLYGEIPRGTVCAKTKAVKGSLTIIPSISHNNVNKKQNHTPTYFKCDGRQHCSQMNSRAEAEFFISNCPNTKMDGDYDGIPCENDSRF